MKKHKFKLEAVLKLREAKEKKIKLELGDLVKEMQKIKDRLVEIENELDLVYRAQEETLETTTVSRELGFYPHAVKGLKADRSSTESLLAALERRYQRKVDELKLAMGETKVMAKLKEKDFAVHRRQAQKKELETLEEIVMLRPKENAS